MSSVLSACMYSCADLSVSILVILFCSSLPAGKCLRSLSNASLRLCILLRSRSLALTRLIRLIAVLSFGFDAFCTHKLLPLCLPLVVVVLLVDSSGDAHLSKRELLLHVDDVDEDEDEDTELGDWMETKLNAELNGEPIDSWLRAMIACVLLATLGGTCGAIWPTVVVLI